MTDTLVYTSSLLAQEHIDELHRDAARDRLVRAARRSRRSRRQHVSLRGLRPATAR